VDVDPPEDPGQPVRVRNPDPITPRAVGGHGQADDEPQNEEAEIAGRH
jgi:hypothetical protein